jgi:hypothetical protein
MKCDTKTMIKTAAGLGLLAIIGYFALPPFRTFILSITPILIGLICPLAMLIMMKGMSSNQREQDTKPTESIKREKAGG